jgi:hypothetical protein
MASQAERSEELRWLQESPGARDVRLVIELGENARLTPGAQRALEQLMKELYDTEVQGYVYQGAVRSMMLGASPLQDCQLSCNQLTCGGLVVKRR